MIPTITDVALALSRWAELSVLSKATILLMLGLAAVWLAGRARASVRHLGLAATFGAILALPIVVATVPDVPIGVPVSRTGVNYVLSAGPATPSSYRLASEPDGGRAVASGWQAPSGQTLLRLVWAGGALLFLAWLARDLVRLRRLRRDGLPWIELRQMTQRLALECGVRRPVEVLRHESIAAPLTCGVWRPAILLPSDAREWDDADLRRALVHELEHVRRGDWLTQVAARAVCACYWFHPLVWTAWRRLCLEAERACDDAAAGAAERTEYAEQLVSLAQRLSKLRAQTALGMAKRSDLSARVSAVLDSSRRRGRAGLLAAATALGAASLVVLAIAPVRAVAQEARPRRVPALDRALIEAAVDGDPAELAGILNAGANVNGKVGGDGSALIVAARGGRLDAMRLLLDRGADVNMPVSGDGNPLIMAAREGRLVAVRLLLDRGADINMPVPGDGNALIMAAREGRMEVVTELLDRGASINQVVNGDENALIQASGSGRLSIVKLLVTRGADVNARVWVESSSRRDGEWRSPLSMARKGGHAAVIAYLAGLGARE